MELPSKDVPRRRVKRPIRRAVGSPHRQTERDCWLLEALAKMQFLVTRQIACLLFNGSRSAANRRLRKLLDKGWVRVWVPNLNCDNIYGLTFQGRRVLLENSGDLDPGIRYPRELDGRIDHLLAINSVRIALATGLPEVGAELAWWQSDWELRAHSRQCMIPDGLFAIRWAGLGDQVFALEVEYGTRAPRSLQSKLLRYAAASYRRSGVYGETDPVVLVVGHDPTWLARYRAALASLALPVPIGFAGLEQVEREGAVGAVWQPLLGDQHLSLRTLASCCYGNDRRALESLGDSSARAAAAAHKYPLRPIDQTNQ